LILPKGKREWFIQIGLALLAVVSVFLIMGLVLDPILTDLGLVKPVVFISYLITIVWFGAALGEELLMRGFLLNTLAQIFGKTKIGWAVSLTIHAIIFGMLHNYQGLAGIITTGFVAIIFGIIYLVGKRRNFPVILAHVLINTIILTAFYLTDGQIN
jgi:membrane protease YdiL (CAAX protease family)